MLIYSSTGERWRGERINDVAHPRNIEDLWTSEELAKLGLKKALAPAVRHQTTDLASAVNAERDRRISVGFEFIGYGFQYRLQDRQRIESWARIASAAVANGIKANDFYWHGGSDRFGYLSAGNDLVPMDAPTMEALANAGVAHEQKMIMAARALKDREGGPPADYANDEHWT